MKRLEVVTSGVWRGSRPELVDMTSLWERGIRTIISLEEGYADIIQPSGEEEWWTDKGGRWINIPCSNIWPPIKRTERVLTNIEIALTDGDVLIHCYSGVDRTGWMAAAWIVRTKRLDPAMVWEQEALAKGTHKWFRWWRPFFIYICRRLNDSRK